ncbi:hypothetical protein HPB52_011103 [Rhipicephalus sanguineus]|uniref:Alpha-macroglobulin receptor-binding domain-containing protein n=1 Tax=Rhipicephalus sanguineus TaxID=34632 RepID=A0A9D4PIK7_RHISA|nr:hypothetical protein HPB52_011103 [Rhipicephalus sanguineus]
MLQHANAFNISGHRCWAFRPCLRSPPVRKDPVDITVKSTGCGVSESYSLKEDTKLVVQEKKVVNCPTSYLRSNGYRMRFGITSEIKRFDVRLHREFAIEDVKPATVKVYDYYEQECPSTEDGVSRSKEPWKVNEDGRRAQAIAPYIQPGSDERIFEYRVDSFLRILL